MGLSARGEGGVGLTYNGDLVYRFGLQARLVLVLRGTVNLQRFGGGGGGWLELSWVMHPGLLDKADSNSASSRCLGLLLLLFLLSFLFILPITFLLSLLFILPISPFCGYYPLPLFIRAPSLFCGYYPLDALILFIRKGEL